MRGSLVANQQGMAIALVLWMIAAMALTVAAISHFAAGDINIALLRLQQAKADAAGRGAALLILQDKAIKSNGQQSKDNPDVESDAEMAGSGSLSRRYTFGQLDVMVTVRPADALVALNGADLEVLSMLFTQIGGSNPSQAANLAQGVVDYRNQSSPVSFAAMYHPGFRYREELLLVPGMERRIYDRVKAFVSPYGSASEVVGAAPRQLAEALGLEVSENTAEPVDEPVSAGTNTPATSSELLTFDNMYSRARGGNEAQLVEVQVRFPDDTVLGQQIWVGSDGVTILRALPPYRIKG